MKALEVVGVVVGFLLVCGLLGAFLSVLFNWSIERDRIKNQEDWNAQVRADFKRRQDRNG